MIRDRLFITEWIRTNRFRFPGFGSWLIGNEPNSQAPETFEGSSLRVLIARLSPYGFVSSSMSHGLLGQLTLEVPGVFVDYCFMPLPREAALFEEASVPPVFGITTKRPFSDFDVIAVSNSVAQELVNLGWMLGKSGIPRDFASRMAEPSIPLIVLGGANAQSAFIACASMSGKGTSLVDALYFGEAEAYWREILGFIRESKEAKKSKLDTLRGLVDRFEALHAPVGAAYETAASKERGTAARCRALVRDASSVKSLVSGPVWRSAETLGYSSISIDFGCPYVCRFCKESWEKRPYRTRPLDAIIADAKEAKKRMGLDTINLFSFNFTSHRDAAKILALTSRIAANVQIKSQRFDGLFGNPEVYAHIRRIGKSNFTFGLEGVSGRIRRFFGKNIVETDVLRALGTIYAGPVRQVKVFLIASGFEDDEDMDELHVLAKRIADIRGASNAAGAPFVLSVTPLIPMPHTPLQFAQFPDERAYAFFMKRLSRIADANSMILRESVSLEEARVAMFLLFSDAENAGCIEAPGADGLFHEYMPKRALKTLTAGFSREWKQSILAQKNASTPFPWDMLYSAEEKDKLYSNYSDTVAELSDRSKDAGKDEPPAFKAGKSGSDARGYGSISAHEHAGAEPIRETALLWFSVETDERLAGVDARFLQVAIARRLMSGDDGIRDAYVKPGPATSGIAVLPAFGTLFVSLEIEKKAMHLVARAVRSLEPDWGYAEEFAAGSLPWKPGFALLEYASESGWEDAFVYGVLNEMNAASVTYDVLKKEKRKSIVMTKQGAKKSGMRSLVWDFERNALSVILDVSEDAPPYITGSRLAVLWTERGKPFRIVRWIGPAIAGKCSVCGSQTLFQSISGGFSKGILCTSCLAHKSL